MSRLPRSPVLVRAIPNALTGLRLVLACSFPFLPPGWRLGAALACAVSDALDGVLARRLGATTWVGALLDGVADKAFTVIVLVTLAAEGVLEWWQTALLLARDATVMLIYAYVAMRRKWGVFRAVAARPAGKATTLLLFAFIIGLLSWPASVPWLMTAAGAASVVAGVDYLLVLGKALGRDQEATNRRDAGTTGSA